MVLDTCEKNNGTNHAIKHYNINSFKHLKPHQGKHIMSVVIRYQKNWKLEKQFEDSEEDHIREKP